MGVCAVALVTPAAGLAAGGTPMPGPDDPPSTLTPSSTKTTTRSSGSQTATTSTKRTAESAVPVPTPDAPLVAAPVAGPRASVTPSVVGPTPDVVQRTAPRVPVVPVVTRTAPRVVAPTTTTMSRTAAKPARKPKPKPQATAKPKLQAKPHHAAPTKPLEPPRRAGVPRDAVRLGLPAAVLAAGPSDAELNGELLVAAALLLAAAAGGSLLLGIAARNSARHA
jgi:hypothetical protein